LLAARQAKKLVEMIDFENAKDKVLMGVERRSLIISEEEKRTIAYHEAGHALVAHMLPHADPVHKVSIVARGGMGGYTRLLSEDRYLMTKSQFNDTLATLLAGHTAEEMIFGEVSTGPHSDIKQATELARKMVTQYGMSELSLRTFGGKEEGTYVSGPEQRDYSEEMARKIDEEVHKLIESAHEVARTVLTENRRRLVHLAKKLITFETLEGASLEAAFTEPVTEVTPV
ncbi:MAG: cell division protein FtsH, partial [Chloroflexi bacterium]|nr:cell division protein FtsH [Chloroflexota bacterium]